MWIKSSQITDINLGDELDWNEIEEKRSILAADLISFLRNALAGEDGTIDKPEDLEDNTKHICPPDLCTSCFACLNGCKQDAISSVLLKDGREVPQIDYNKCIGCNNCRKICPQLNNSVFHDPSVCYAAQWKNKEKRINSSSGGVGALLAESIIARGGCVVGADIDDTLEVKHRCAETVEEAERFKTSKYVHSNTGFIFREVQRKLRNGKELLFIGTPCQVAGLNSFLEKKYNNLITVDVMCHGTPPMIYLNQHIKGKVEAADGYSFRGGEKDMLMRITRGSLTKL